MNKLVKRIGVSLINFVREFKINFIQMKHGYGKEVVLVNYGLVQSKMLVDFKDGGLSIDLYLYGIREPSPTKIFSELLKPGMVVVDIGANLGYYAILESLLVGKGHIYVVEPVLENCSLLSYNINLNNCTNIELFQQAIGDKNCFRDIFVPKKRNQTSFFVKPNKGIRQRVKVETLDTFLIGKSLPDFLRMDVEGYEFEILKGMKETLTNSSPQIFIEVHQGIMGIEKTREFFKLLKGYGYENCRIVYEVTRKYRFLLPFLELFDGNYRIDTKKKTVEVIKELEGYFDTYHVFLSKNNEK